MIFVTVGMQLPFNRLVRTVEAWAKKHKASDVIFQVGPGGYFPSGFSASQFIKPEQFEQYVKKADVVVSHAGMGSILKSLELAKPIIILPRLQIYGEHRNNHQVHTAENIGKYEGVLVAKSETDVEDLLDVAITFTSGSAISKSASDSLIAHIQYFIRNSIPKSDA
ncbi:glycosyltransferase [Marispirochaeta aestuarii]|uniref:glycosyltransferase n=1 Tax=Marispirochaeta aestuarii TaxID=1963862 RepID=UPI001301EB78|nr:glycosyltransferase [Marispirochaeta aestuarii]